MRKTHTSQQTSKCITHIICRIFWYIFNLKKQIILDAQTNEYNKKLSTTPNAYDTPQDNRNTTPTAPKIHNLHNNL